MAVINIAHTLLSGTKNRIDRVGIELEGGWIDSPTDKHSRIERDGSVKGFPNDIPWRGGVGEIASPPIPVALIEEWVLKNYPSHINKTCGLHVHMSFAHALNYQRLMVESYQDTMIDYLHKWAVKEGLDKNHILWDRLAGKCEHCQLKFWPDKQVRQTRKNYERSTEGHRYTAINYCYGLQNVGSTVEVRVLPMMDTASQAVRAIDHIIDVTNACLVKLAAKEKSIIADIDFNEDDQSPFIDQAVALYN